MITSRQAEQMKDAMVRQKLKVDPELPELLAARSRQRKEELLERGLSTRYVSMYFVAYRNNLVTG